MIEYLSDPPHIFFVWMFSITILFILGLLFWMMRDSEMAEPATMLLVGLVAVSILLGVEIMQAREERAKAEAEVNVATPVKDVHTITITQAELDDIRSDLVEMTETILILLEITERIDAKVESPDPRNDPLPSR